MCDRDSRLMSPLEYGNLKLNIGSKPKNSLPNYNPERDEKLRAKWLEKFGVKPPEQQK